MTVNRDIWILATHTGDAVDETTFGLIAEARDIISREGGSGRVTAVIMGIPEDAAFASLKNGGADRIIHIRHESLNRYNGELFASLLFDLANGRSLSCILLAHNEGRSDLAPRLSAMMNSALITRAMAISFDKENRAVAIRPVSNGYLFEEVVINTDNPPVISYLPSVLSAVNPYKGPVDTPVEIISPEIDECALSARVIKVIKSAPENLSIEDASIVVAGGRGAGKGDAFNILHELAREIGASVGGTRPVIDLQILPFERQIGQTGKTIAPDLIINCGVSGANEYSAGMEKSKNVISINKDPRARIFRFSDLGVVGDLNEIVPLLIERVREVKEE
ncbi:MAG: electron transfer flavoprotein subunit alpha/FixB family protein [Deltaproteobacteria bacterium]|nr:electron transfer flavoprotein subunit alpha/FixB family protein [Deltaproteobacteria bacterium]